MAKEAPTFVPLQDDDLGPPDDWQPSTHLRRFDDTPKLTNPRLQQRWCKARFNEHGQLCGWEFQWRDVPVVWEPGN